MLLGSDTVSESVLWPSDSGSSAAGVDETGVSASDDDDVATGVLVVDVFLGFGIFRLTSFCSCISSVLARAFISVVEITGSSFIFTDFCFSTHSFSHFSCSFSVFSSASSSSLVHFDGSPAVSSAVRFALASVRNSRVPQFHFWLLFKVCGNASISWYLWIMGLSRTLSSRMSTARTTNARMPHSNALRLSRNCTVSAESPFS